MTKRLIGLLLTVCCLSFTALSQTTESKPKPTPKPKTEQFSAVASLPRSPTRTAWVDFRINSYTGETTQRMAAVLIEGGQDALVKELEKADTIGHASLSSRIGFFDLKLIRSRKTPTGRRIIAFGSPDWFFGSLPWRQNHGLQTRNPGCWISREIRKAKRSVRAFCYMPPRSRLRQPARDRLRGHGSNQT